MNAVVENDLAEELVATSSINANKHVDVNIGQEDVGIETNMCSGVVNR